MTPARESLISSDKNRASRPRHGSLVLMCALTLALMTSGRPSGQVAAGTAVDFDGTNDFITFGQAAGPALLGG